MVPMGSEGKIWMLPSTWVADWASVWGPRRARAAAASEEERRKVRREEVVGVIRNCSPVGDNFIHGEAMGWECSRDEDRAPCRGCSRIAFTVFSCGNFRLLHSNRAESLFSLAA